MLPRYVTNRYNCWAFGIRCWCQNVLVENLYFVPVIYLHAKYTLTKTKEITKQNLIWSYDGSDIFMDWEGVNTFVQRLYTSPPPSPWRSQSIGIFSESDTCRSCLFNIILPVGKVYMYFWSTCNNIQQTTRYASDNILYQRQTSVWYTSTYPEMLYFLWIK